MNVTYPLVDKEFVRFCAGKKAILIVEEGQPDYIEQAVNTILRRADIQTEMHGKDMLPMAGEYTGGVVREGIRKFIAKVRPGSAAGRRAAADAAPLKQRENKAAALVAADVHGRPPSFCTGCPERPIFAAMKLVERELGTASRQRRHRLPPVLDLPAVQCRRHDDGLRPRRRRRLGAERQSRQARHLDDGRRRLLA